jgi:hypothetical protein
MFQISVRGVLPVVTGKNSVSDAWERHIKQWAGFEPVNPVSMAGKKKLACKSLFKQGYYPRRRIKTEGTK